MPAHPLIGKKLLVGLTYLDAASALERRLEQHGLITAVGVHAVTFARADGKGSFSILFDGSLAEADPAAIYTLRSTGEALTGVEVLATFTIHGRPDAASDAQPAD